MRDLVFIGIFAAVSKAAVLIIALVGGGMNPFSLALKNFVYTALMLVLAHKVAKPWTLTMADTGVQPHFAAAYGAGHFAHAGRFGYLPLG